MVDICKSGPYVLQQFLRVLNISIEVEKLHGDMVKSVQPYQGAALALVLVESCGCVYRTISYESKIIFNNDFSRVDGWCHHAENFIFEYTGHKLYELILKSSFEGAVPLCEPCSV